MTVSCEIEHVGIDVSKSDLVLGIFSEDRIETFPNTPVGVARLRVRFEATGRYEWPL